jgi:hypothetical protein
MGRHTLFAMGSLLAGAGVLGAGEARPGGVTNVVLVHVGFVDGSVWEAVY